ncbi:MAG: hypothetical protein ACK5LP_01995, partial [Campylobacteraceae bacterium]
MQKLIILLIVLLFLGCESKEDTSTYNPKIIPSTNKGNLSMGENYIPPSIPNQKENDKTLHGIDSNFNG